MILLPIRPPLPLRLPLPLPLPIQFNPIPSSLKPQHNKTRHFVLSSIDPDLKILSKFDSSYNSIQVVEVARGANHTLAGSRILLLDKPGNIHSIHYLTNQNQNKNTDTYFDVFATIPPIIPSHKAPIAMLGFGAGYAANLILEQYNETIIHGWEIDEAVIYVAREFFGLEELEDRYGKSRLFIHIGNALDPRDDHLKFSAILVDLFANGAVVPELQESKTWARMQSRLVDGGRIMANCGGSCVEAEDPERDGHAVMEDTIKAMAAVFGAHQLFVLNLGRANGSKRDNDSFLALTGALPDREAWRNALPNQELGLYVDCWNKFNQHSMSS